MYVLGLHCGHDSAAALLRDGIVVADAQEERFSRIKHTAGFPHAAVGFCLETANIEMEAIDVVAIAGSRPSYATEVMLDRQSSRTALRSIAQTLPIGRLRPSASAPPRHLRPYRLRSDVAIDAIRHHQAHASTAQFTNQWRQPYLIVTADGEGDNESLTVSLVDGASRSSLLSVGPEGSLGWFYGIVTEALGWAHGDGEGKTMGLAPYGTPSIAYEALRPYCPSYRFGVLDQGRRWQGPHSWNADGSTFWHFGEADAVAEIIDRHGRANVAAAAQQLLEDELGGVVAHWLRATGVRSLACSGGVFLNVKLNQRIWSTGSIDNHHVYPNCGDAGLAVGAAFEAYSQRVPSWTGAERPAVYTGVSVEGSSSREALDLSGFAYRELEHPGIEAAELLANGDIVAWAQGRAESGPRALGNRSFLMSPLRPEAKDTMNARVKFREGFRPFCPSLLFSSWDDYLVKARDEPFMITSFEATPLLASQAPAVVHVDGTVRPQAVTSERNTRYAQLLTRFGELTGHPVILNTSLNVRGEPIVNSPVDALRCFAGGGSDHLVLDNFLVSKR